MNSIIVAIIVSFGFIGMPLVFFYIMVIMPLKKYRRCSELVEGTVKYIDKEVRYSRDGDTHYHGTFYIATCDYYYRGEKYTSDVESKNRRFKVSEGETLRFYVNPNNPLETHMRYKIEVVKYVAVTAFLATFVFAGIICVVGTSGNKEPNVKVASESTDNPNVDNEVKHTDGDTSNTGEQNSKLISYYSTEEASKIILANKNAKLDIKESYIKKAKKITLNGAVLYVPKTYVLNKHLGIKLRYIDETTGDSFTISVGDTIEKKLENNKIRRGEMDQHGGFNNIEFLRYNGTEFMMCYTEDGSGIIYVCANSKDRNMFIRFLPGEKSNVDLRDILSSMIL